jgi:hypothetical protein
MYTYGVTGSNINEFIDVNITSPSEFQVLEFNGTSWVNQHASVTTYVRNADSVTLGTGTAVYLFGATGDHASVKRADNDSDATSSKTVGLVAAPIDPNENGTVVTRGYVDGIDLSVGYTAGDILWLGEDGGFTKVKPTAPEHLVFIGVVVRATNNGIVYVAVQNGYELDELHNVALVSPALGNVLTYNPSTSLWVNAEPRQITATLQTPVDGRRYTQLGTSLFNVSGVAFGAATRVVFKTACEIDALSVFQNGTYGGANVDFRLGIYNDDDGKPGSLAVDAGLLTIATGSTAGFKELALGTALSVSAGTPVWLVCGAPAGTTPNLSHHAGHVQPYSDYGLNPASTLASQAAAFSYTGGNGALPATFTLNATESTAVGVAVYAKVNIP